MGSFIYVILFFFVDVKGVLLVLMFRVCFVCIVFGLLGREFFVDGDCGVVFWL